VNVRGVAYVLIAGVTSAPTGIVHPLGDAYQERLLLTPLRLGQPVRVVGERECDGTLSAPVELAHPVGDEIERAIAARVFGCSGEGALFAVVYPHGAARVEGAEADARAALDAARAAVRGITSQGEGEIASQTIGFDDALYALVSQSSCEEGGDTGCTSVAAAVAHMKGDGSADLLIARPASSPWEDADGAHYVFAGITDWNGDGTIELVEQLSSDRGTMVRLIEPSPAERAGRVVWSATTDVEGGIRPRLEPQPSGGPP
jgi:hypothetical protein